METFKPITCRDDLPPVGRPIPEHLLLDLKAIKGEDPRDWEKAKDIASFANTRGGVILVGAEEVNGILQRYTTVSFDEAKRISENYQRATDRCRPKPVINPIPIERDSGSYVLAVNVYAYPAIPIGLGAEGKGEGQAWYFPTRRADDTHYLSPEELATIMDAVYRRKVLLVEQIQPREQGRVAFFHFVDMWKLLYEKQARTGASAKPIPHSQMTITAIDPVRGVGFFRRSASMRMAPDGRAFAMAERPRLQPTDRAHDRRRRGGRGLVHARSG